MSCGRREPHDVVAQVVLCVEVKRTMSAVSAGPPPDLPRDVSKFSEEPRIAFSQATSRWIYEDLETGVEYEFDEHLKDWIEVPNETAIERQQAAYTLNEHKRSPTAELYDSEQNKDERPGKRRKQEDKKHMKEGGVEMERKPTAIYISGLPKDTTMEEIETVFSKYGLIAENLNTGEKRIKLYTDEDGEPKGDALVVYFKPESVPLAIEMMDGYEFRYGAGKVSVQIAKFDKDKSQDADSTKPTQRDKPTGREKAKIQKRLQQLNEYVPPIAWCLKAL